jgi:hypothetical protein
MDSADSQRDDRVDPLPGWRRLELPTFGSWWTRARRSTDDGVAWTQCHVESACSRVGCQSGGSGGQLEPWLRSVIVPGSDGRVLRRAAGDTSRAAFAARRRSRPGDRCLCRIVPEIRDNPAQTAIMKRERAKRCDGLGETTKIQDHNSDRQRPRRRRRSDRQEPARPMPSSHGPGDWSDHFALSGGQC